MQIYRAYFIFLHSELRMRIEIATNPNVLLGLQEKWRDLAQNSRITNIFNEPEMLVPALQFLTGNRKIQVALLWEKKELVGLFPFAFSPTWRGLPLKHFILWNHPYSFLSTPLIRSDYLITTFNMFLKWIVSVIRYPYLIECHHISSELFSGDREGFLSLLEKCKFQSAMHLESRPGFNLQSYVSFEDYWQTRSRAFRKKYRQRFRQLTEQGIVKVERLPLLSEGGSHEALHSWIEDFLLLEQQGWKGRQGTAMCSNQAHAHYFSRIVSELFKTNKLHFMRLSVNGETIAGKCSFSSGGKVFCFKIAYREKFARSSPGLLLEVEFIREMMRSSEFSMIDSCARPDHPLFESIWEDSISTISGILYRGKVFGILRGVYRQSLQHSDKFYETR